MMTLTLPSIMNLNPLLPPILNPTLATILVLLMNCIQAQIQKAKTTASGNDAFESITSNGPSTDFIGDSTTALLEDNFTASDDTLSTTNFASVSDDPMTWSVSPATMVALPKPYPPPSPPVTMMPLTSTVPHPSVIPPLSTSIGSGASRMKVISCERAIIALFVGAIFL